MQPAPITTISILIADDHAIFREGLKLLLKKIKIEKISLLGEASTGKELVSKALELKPDIILTDIQMPEMDGIEATKSIKKENPNIHVIALSMFNEEHLVMDMLDAGASGYLLKNTSKEELQQALKQIKTGGMYFTPETFFYLAKSLQRTSGKPVRPQTVNFTAKELCIVKLICQGYTNKEIGEKLFLSSRTIETHRERIREKTKTTNTLEMVVYALKNTLVNITDL